ncbi:MAG: hypothetical protein H6607_09540 [Flavobacteriales bacterium]|nr:hypothetical protein [Flavobacteriales bacterium]
MRKLRVLIPVLFVSLVVLATSCKKKNDPRNMVYKAWKVTAMEDPNMDASAIQATISEGYMVEFTKKGKMISTVAGKKSEGTFEIDETATTIKTTENGTTDNLSISGLSETGMTLTNGSGAKMTLSAN